MTSLGQLNNKQIMVVVVPIEAVGEYAGVQREGFHMKISKELRTLSGNSQGGAASEVPIACFCC
jgi:hypothetical protein